MLAMFSKTIVALLLLSCLGAKGTSLGVTKQPLLEEDFKATDIVIKNIHLEITAPNPKLQFCADNPLPPGTPKLNYGVISPDADQKTVEGSRDDADTACAIFMMDPSFTLPDVATRYEWLIIDNETPALGRSISTFAMTAKTTILTCGTEMFTKVTWGPPTPIVYTKCLTMDTSLSDEDVCYHKEDVWAGDFCFGITDQELVTITICMKGLTSPKFTEGSPVSTNYFYYGQEALDNGPGKATLSLAMGPSGLTHLRAIVRPITEAGSETVCDCPNNECTYNAYDRKFANYEVCVETMNDDKETQEIATTTFTDMNLNVFGDASQKSTLMEFAFANWIDGKIYSARYSLTEPVDGVLGDNDPNTVNLDCTGLEFGHACMGFLDTGTYVGTLYLAISDPAGINTTVTPYVAKGPSGEPSLR